jgi:enoyl-CoA hydratase/carnithine racemase
MSVLISNADGVCVVQLDRAERKNALTDAMYEQLAGALRSARNDAGVRVVALLGASGVFTAGHDLQGFLQTPPRDDSHPVFQFLAALAECPKPVIAGVDGPAVGVGTTLLLHCDVVIASRRAWFQLPFVDLGLVPEAGSTLLLARRVGEGRARRWLMGCERVSAEMAFRDGLVDELVEEPELLATVDRWARMFAQKDPEAIIETKALLTEATRDALRDAMKRESERFVARLHHETVQKRLRSFFSKR